MTQMFTCVVSCTCELKRGQSGDGLCEVLTLCRYDRRNGDLFLMVRHCALVSDASDVFVNLLLLVLVC